MGGIIMKITVKARLVASFSLFIVIISSVA